MEFFNKGRAILDIERAQRTAEESRVVNTAFEQEFLAKTGGYAELKLTDLTTGSSFVDESFNRIRTASYIEDKRYSLNPKSTTWVLYQTHPTVYEIQDTGLTASSSVWMTEETAGYCYIVGTDDDTTLTVFQFDGTSLSEITLSASISYSTNIDVATLPSGELVVFTAGTSYAIVSQNGDVTSGTHLASAVDQIFVEKVGNAICFIGVTSGDIISGITVDGQNYKNWDNWITGDRSGDDGDTNSSYAVQSGTGIQIVDTHVQTGGFSALASDGTSHYLFIATNGGYQIIEPDFSDIEADISQTLTVKDKANSTIVAHGYYDTDLYTLVLDNQSTTKTLSAYRGILSQSKTLSSIEQSSTITLPTLSAPERLYGLRESFYQNSDTNAAIFSVYFGTGFVSSNILSPAAAEADTLQTVTDRGATTTNEIEIPSVQFDTTQTLTPTSGQLGWNADDETLDLGLNGGGVVHKLGETLFFNVKAAEAISKGDVLYASGAVGNSGKIEASKYTANNTIDENQVLGVAAEDISIGDFGFVYFLGSLRGITTDGSDVGETWVDGTILYASDSTAGALTSIQPVAPNQDIPIAFVTSAKANNGALYVRATQLGYHLDEIHDVYAPSPSDGEVLTWNNANQRWEASSIAEADTLDTVTTRGNTTTNSITVSSATVMGSLDISSRIRRFGNTGTWFGFWSNSEYRNYINDSLKLAITASAATVTNAEFRPEGGMSVATFDEPTTPTFVGYLAYDTNGDVYKFAGSGTTPSLQDVMDVGSTTSTDITFTTNGGGIINANVGDQLYMASYGNLVFFYDLTKTGLEDVKFVLGNNPATDAVFTLDSSGNAILNNYGLGSVTGTPTFNIAVDSNGKLIETGLPPEDLDDLNDVNAPNPSDGDVLTWDSATQKWIPDTSGAVVSVTPTLNGGDTLLWDGDNEQGYFESYNTRQFNYARTGNIANVNLYLEAISDNQMGTGELEADLRFFLPNTMAIRDDNFPPRQPIGTATVSDGRTFMVMRSGAKQVRFYSLDASGEAPLLANDSAFMPSQGGNGYMLLQATYMAVTISGTAPTANFTTSQNALEVTYTSDAEDAYLWGEIKGGTLKAGEDLRAQSIVVVYPSFGTYDTPTLRVANNYGTDSFVSTITLADATPVASFTISDATPNVGQIITFTDTSTETPTSWSWAISPSTYVFEGGTSATSQNPQIAFLDESENYTVNLTATNASGSDSTAFTNNVVSNALEAVHFEFDPYLYLDADNEGTQVPTTYGSPTYNSAGYYAFDGTDDAFYYDYSDGINDATGAIEAFIDWDNSQDGIVFSFGRDDASSYRGQIILRSSDNTIRFVLRKALSNDQIQLNWNFAGTSGKYHIVINKTASGGSSPSYNYEMYINGVNQGNADSDTSTASTGYWFDDTSGFTPYNLMVGARLINNITLPETEIIGDIYRAAVYQDALSATRISENYNWLLER